MDSKRKGPIVFLLTLTTAAIHLLRAVVDPGIRILFSLNGLGYLGLLLLLYLQRFTPRRGLVRRALIAYTGLTILIWVVWGIVGGGWTATGVVDKAVEITLVGLLWGQDRREKAIGSPGAG